MVEKFPGTTTSWLPAALKYHKDLLAVEISCWRRW